MRISDWSSDVCSSDLVDSGVAAISNDTDSSAASLDGDAKSEAAQLLDVIPVKSLHPEEALPVTPAPRSTSRVIEEIVVTAQKREESQQDVPISIQAYSGGALEALGVEDPTQVGRLVPGFQFSSVAGYTLLYLRGVGTDAFVPSSDPSVATYIDGVYMPSAHGVIQSFGGIERVEVLKGPQGSIFGGHATDRQRAE